MEYGVYGDHVIIHPKLYSIYSRGTISLNPKAWNVKLRRCSWVLAHGPDPGCFGLGVSGVGFRV